MVVQSGSDLKGRRVGVSFTPLEAFEANKDSLFLYFDEMKAYFYNPEFKNQFLE